MPARLPLLTAEPRRTTVLGIFFSLSIGFYCVELLAFPPMIAKLNSIPTHNWLQTWRGEGYTVCEGGGHNINITTIVIMFLSTHKIYRYISRRNWQTSPQCGIDYVELGHFLFCSLTQPKFKVSVIYGGNENEIPLPCSRQRFAPLLLGPDFPASPLFPRVTRNT